jgi:hypothetical protein
MPAEPDAFFECPSGIIVGPDPVHPGFGCGVYLLSCLVEFVFDL